MSELPQLPDRNEPAPTTRQEAGYVILPVDPDQFKDFVKGLLGRPQSISRVLHGPFEIDATDIQNLDRLLAQRIEQQNAGLLAQFNARLVFSDESTIELNTLAELISYNEVRPVYCNAIHLRWDYLVTFPDKKVPQKQSILVSYVLGAHATLIDTEDVLMLSRRADSSGAINFRIEHTARTWGADIEALMSNFLQAHIRKENPIKTWIRSHHAVISFVTAIGFIAMVSLGIFVTSRQYASERMADLNAMLVPGSANIDKILSYIGQILASGAWAQFSFAAVFFLVVSFFVAIWLGMWTDEAAANYPPSFILINRQSVTHRDEVLAKQRKKWLSFCGSVLTTVILGVLSNYIFAHFFGR